MFKAMMCFVITILTLLLSAELCFSAQACVAVLNSADLSAEQLENVKIDTQSISSFFSDLALTYDVPIGLEVAANDNQSARYYVEFKKGPLAEFLTQFVTEHTQYTWQIVDGVVNVFPKDGYRDPLSQDLLAVKLGKFAVRENTSCWNFIASLLDRPEMKTILEANDTTYSRRSPSGFYIPQLGRKFTLEVSDLMVGSILNKVIGGSPTAKFWVIKRNSDRTLFLHVSAHHEDSLKTRGKRPLQELLGEDPRQ